MKLLNLTGVELKLLQRSLGTSAEKFAKFCREVCEVDWRRAKASAEKFWKLTGTLRLLPLRGSSILPLTSSWML